MVRKQFWNLLQVLLGTFILCISVEYFIIPFNILSGGVAGIAVAMEPFFHVDETLLANSLEVILLFVGWAFLGREFAMKTVISSLSYPLFNMLLMRHPAALEIDPILASFYAGLLGGVGIGIVMRTGASTGGMDIPPLVINRITGLKVASLVMVVDALTVALGIAAYGVSPALIGLVSVFSSGYAIDRILSFGSGSNAKSVQIISDHWKEIKEKISSEIDRGTTLINAKGGFSGSDRIVVLCVVSQRQYTRLLDIIREIDDKAFVITTDATDMHGEGFTYSSPNI